MEEPFDPNKTQKELLESIRKIMSQIQLQPDPQTERISEEEEEKTKSQKREEHLQFNLKPKDIKKHLDRFVIKQEEAKRVLATAICDHYHHVRICEGTDKCRNYAKQNIIMLGPTGVGKTYLIKILSELIGVPFIKADATKFSETGYVGGDVEDVARDLVHKADGDIKLAECGMIYLDEVDKIASAANMQGRDVSGAGVQRGLLKIMEDTEVPLRNPQDIQSQIQAMMEFQKKGKISRPTINTRHILFIVSGSFTELPALIERRIREGHIGFHRENVPPREATNLLKQTKTEDLIKYGYEPEFVGRLPVRVVCEPLTAEDLYQVLTTSEGSIIRQYEASFAAYDIKITFQDSALWAIAKIAAEEKTGARGLVTVCEKILRDLKYELPSSRLKEFVVTEQMVYLPQQALEELLREEHLEKRGLIRNNVKNYEESFFRKTGIRIAFEEPALTLIEERILKEELEVAAFLDSLLSNYHYGLGLVQKKRPREQYLLGGEVILNPNEVLEKWIKATYENPEENPENRLA